MTLLFELVIVGLLVMLLTRVNRIEKQSERAAKQLDEALRRLEAGVLAAQKPRTDGAPSFPAASLQAVSPAAAPASRPPTQPHFTVPDVLATPAPTLPKLAPPLPQFTGTPVKQAGASAATLPQPTGAAKQHQPAAPARTHAPPAWWPAINLSAPEYSRARMSVIGGGLVIAGLAWTLRSLGLPGWTALAAVYAFAALLWITARSVPQPVAGALRGLGYAAAALGLGALSQVLGPVLPQGAGVQGSAATVLLGLLALSGAMAWRSVRAGEPLLAALATLGAAISTWMLTDDLGPWSALAMGLTALMPALAIPHLMRLVPGREEQGGPSTTVTDHPPEKLSPETGLAREASLVLTVLAAAAIPVGHLLAALSHAPDLSSVETTARSLVSAHGGTWGWAIGTVMALGTAATLLRGAHLLPSRSQATSTPAPSTATSAASLLAAMGAHPYRTLGTAAALCMVTPFLTAAPTLGAALQRAAPGSTGALLLLALVGAALAAWAWIRQRQSAAQGQADAAYLAGSLAGGATAGTTSALSAAAVALLGSNTRLLGFAGLGAALASVGLAAHNRRWAQVGIALASVSVMAALVSPYVGGPAAPQGVVLLVLAGFWVLGMRLSQRAWKEEASALAYVTGASMALLALSGLLEAALLSLVAGAALWAVQRTPRLAALKPLIGGLFLATIACSALTSTAAFKAGPGLDLTQWSLLLLGAAGAALALLASRSVASPLATRQTAGAGQDSLADGAAKIQPPEALAPFVQSASWSVLALSLLVTVQSAGALSDEAGAVALSVMALITHRMGLRRGPTISAFSLSAAGILTFSGVVRLIADQLMDAGNTQTVVSWLPLATWSTLGIWGLLYTPTGRRLWTARISRGSLPRMPLRILRAPVIAAGLATATVSLTAWVPGGLMTAPLLTLGSLAALATGVLVALGAWRWGGLGRGGARALWDCGVGIGAAAGVKAVTVDASLYSNPRAASGLAILVTGLALLLLAVRAPRPGPSEGAEGSEGDPGAALVVAPARSAPTELQQNV
ncbi:hypothetical protein [Deinococcus sp. QL22]|uniref:hypothetical protein n=1 Tax=Deinococcus sp. QL22 TaxID=2939437 RepID=UPI002018270A|nr:hypothetical protein [Deinococcus sp. QL22]UQN06487.1 hypothetical protein M1R55_00790 [Deinococcus sp. QL22]